MQVMEPDTVTLVGVKSTFSRGPPETAAEQT
jgi:hypothetical protein